MSDNKTKKRSNSREKREKGPSCKVQNKNEVKKSDYFHYFGRSIAEDWNYNDLKENVG